MRNKGSQWLGVMALAAGALTAGCSSSSTSEDKTSVVSQTVEAASDSSDAVEVSSLLRGMRELRPEAVEGFHCDPTPDVTNVEVCGKSLPATVHLEWTSCAAPQRGDHGGHDGEPGGGFGGMPPPSGSGTPPPARPDGGPRFSASNGTVDIAYTYSAADDCSGAVTQNQSVTFQISRTGDDGSVETMAGTTSSSAQLVADAPPRQKATQADVTRTLTDSTGAVTRSVHLVGSMSTEFSSDTPPARTVNGSYTESFQDGSQGTVTLENIVRPPRNVCPWPTSGTLTRATSDGQTHALVFGPDCGSATLDGATVDLPQQREGGHRGGFIGGGGRH
jgi:hypothetical protein